MPRRTLGRWIGTLLVAALVASAAGGASDGNSNTASSTQIGSCTTITDPGRYTLTSDVEGEGSPCLVIDSDGVTLDGANHSVVRRNASSLAVRITGVNVTVRNVYVAGGVEYNTGDGAISRVSASGGELFVDARRVITGDRTAVERTVRVSDGSSSVSSSSSGPSSVRVRSSRSSSHGSLWAFDGTLWEDDESLSGLCGFARNER